MRQCPKCFPSAARVSFHLAITFRLIRLIKMTSCKLYNNIIAIMINMAAAINC